MLQMKKIFFINYNTILSFVEFLLNLRIVFDLRVKCFENLVIQNSFAYVHQSRSFDSFEFEIII
jgi:hypothetical protein